MLQRAGVIGGSQREFFDMIAACTLLILAVVLTSRQARPDSPIIAEVDPPYRGMGDRARPTPEVPPVKRQDPERKAPFLWNARVWWASRKMSFGGDKFWTVKFMDAYGKQQIMSCSWPTLAGMAEECANVIAGEAYANRLKDGRVWLVSPACVPTLAREAKKAAMAYAKLPPASATPEIGNVPTTSPVPPDTQPSDHPAG